MNHFEFSTMSEHTETTESSDVQSGLNRRRFLHLTGATGVAFGLAGCAGSGGDGGSTTTEQQKTQTTSSGSGGSNKLIWGHSEVTQKLDVHIIQTAASSRFLNNIHQTLVGLTNKLEVSSKADIQDPGLAKNWEISDDRKQYTFTLRDGVKFHDGSTLTSADVKYSFDRIRNPDLGARYKGIIDHFEEVKTPDDKTVVIDLGDERYNPILRQLAFLGTAIIPEGSGSKQGKNPIGTGPFKFESRQQGNKSILKAHDEYWGNGPYIDTVEERTVTDPDTRLTGVQEGSYDFINDIPLDNMKDVINNQEDNLQTSTWRPLAFNHIYFHTGQAPFDNLKWREAIVYAIDKQQLVDGALFGQGTPIQSPSYPNSPYRNNNLEPRPQDPDKAKSLIDNSEYSLEEYTPLTFKVTTNYPWHIDAATIMQQHFSQAGIDIEIQKLQWGDWLSEITNMNYRISMVNWFGGWEPAQMYRGLWHSDGGFNAFAYSSDRYDNAIEKAETAPSKKKEIEWYKKAQKILHEELPSPFLWFRDGAMAAKQSVQNIETILDPDNTAVNFSEVRLNE
ncbi:MAG: ABC transporter substrate-binding protein [Halobacteriales archaeon]|nr:ABC transporter substrate-binding protein [Halobacteriales archaeon]